MARMTREDFRKIGGGIYEWLHSGEHQNTTAEARGTALARLLWLWYRNGIECAENEGREREYQSAKLTVSLHEGERVEEDARNAQASTQS